jgi:hypothetical protein
VPASFDVRTIVLLRRGINPPDLDEQESTALHHAHLAYLATLVERGIIAANGPLLDQYDETMREMSVYTVDAVEARRLACGLSSSGARSRPTRGTPSNDWVSGPVCGRRVWTHCRLP